MTRTMLAALVLLLTAAATPAYLIVTTDEPTGLENPESVFEGTITAHAVDGDRGTVTVRVTDDWTRIYCGRRHLGTTRVIPYEGSAVRRALQFAQTHFAGRVLLVVDRKEGRVEIVCGVPADADVKGYRVLSWNNRDHGIVSRVATARMHARSTGVMSIPDALVQLDVRDERFRAPALTHRWLAAASAFHRALSRRLEVGPRRELTDDEVRARLAELGHAEYGRRCAAQRAIERVAAHAPDRLRDALAAATDPEVRRRLERALTGSAERRAIERAAVHLEKQGDAAVAAAVDWKPPALARGAALIPHVRILGTDLREAITLRPIVPTVFPTPLELDFARVSGDLKIEIEKRK